MFLVPYDSPVPPSAWTKWGNTCETNKPGRCWLRSSSSSSALEADRASSHLNSRVPNLSPTNHLFQEATLLISSAFADFLVTCDMWFFGHMWHVTNKSPLAKPPRGLIKPVLLLILTLAEFVQKPLLHWLTAVLAGFYFDSLASFLISCTSPALSRTVPKDGKLPWNG